jgi:hypothetical protein
MATNDYYDFISLESEMTVNLAMKGVHLRNLKNHVSKKNVVKSLSFLIKNFNDNFNSKGKLNVNQIILLASDLFDRFSYESLEDVMLMFKYARQGKIGDGKDFKLDSQTVFHKWVPEYLELKSIERETRNTQNKGKDYGLANFNWSKEDLKHIDIPEESKKVAGETLGTRVKGIFNTNHLQKPMGVVNQNYYKKAKIYVKNHSTEKLKTYLNAEKKQKISDKSLVKIVEDELLVRVMNKKPKIK